MALIDVVLLIMLGGFILAGFWFGAIHTFGSLVGTIVGAWVAGNYYAPFAEWGRFIWRDGDVGYILAFAIILIVVNRLVGLGFYLLDRLFAIISIIPFLSSINRLLGIGFGFLEGVFTIGLVLFFIDRYPVNDWLANQLMTAELVPWFISTTQFVAPILPSFLRQLQTVI